MFFYPFDEPEQASEGKQTGNDITDRVFLGRNMQPLRSNEDITAAYHRHEQRRYKRDEVAETILASLS